MNILVTGGAGFIGSNVVDGYIEGGHNVIVVDDLSSGNLENVNPQARFHRCDIRDDGLRAVFGKERIDVVNHHAAQMDVRRSVEDPLFDASVNVLGTLNLLEQCREHGVKQFMFASTGGAIYGEQDYFPADENHPARPLSPYGITKLAAEKYLYYYHAVFGLPYVSLRYANVYGPRQNPHGEAGVVAIFTSKMIAGLEPIINGDGKQTRDYVFVEDVVRANIAALNHRTSDTFNIGTGVETDVNCLFALLRSLTQSNSREKHGPAKKGEQGRSVINHAKAEKTLGWKPAFPLEQGLKKTVEYFISRNHRDRA